MIKLIVGLVLIAHGIGHTMGPLGMFKVATVNPAWRGDSWILSGIAGEGPTQAIGTLLWTVALVGFVVLGAVVLGWLPETWWQPIAIGSSVISLAGIALFPLAFPVFSTIGAAAIDIAVLVAVIGYGWVPGDLSA